MKNERVTIVLIFTLACLPVYSQSAWKVKASLIGSDQLDWKMKAGFGGGARTATCAFALGSYGYVFGGTDITSDYSELYQYSPGSNSWAKKASMPITGMREPAAFTIDTVAYVGLGFRAGATAHLSHMYKYSPLTNTWTAVKSFYQGRRAAAGFSIDSLGYIIGGYEYGSTPDNSLYSYSPKTNTWTKQATMPGTGRAYPTCGVYDNKAYVMGGLTLGGTYLKDFYRYDAASNTWTTLTNFPGDGRTTASCVVIDSIIYFGCGKTSTTHYQDWYGYNTTTNQWFQITSFPSIKTYSNAFFSIAGKGYLTTGAYNSTLTDSTFELSFSPTSGERTATCGFAIGSYGYVFGGTNLTKDNSELYQYDPLANTWKQKSSMPLTGMREPAAFTIDTVAYVGLGFRAGATSHLSHMYKYSPATNSWTTVQDFYQGRRAAAGFAIDSLGYIIGGYEYGSTPDNSLYSYSPKTNSWTKRATMPGGGRAYPTCGVVNKKVYVMGGLTLGGTYLKDFYAYDPSTNTWATLTSFPGDARTTASAIIIDSVVYFGCGKNLTTHFRDWWGYNTVTKQWSQIVDFPSVKTYGNAFFSLNNKGYLSSGANFNDLTDSTFELSVVTASIAKTKNRSNVGIVHASLTNIIQVKSVNNGDLNLHVYDGSGKLVFAKIIAMAQEEIAVEIPQFSRGIYIVEAIQGSNRQSKKIVL